jgi:methanogenic corrinoid protein MtbC1
MSDRKISQHRHAPKVDSLAERVLMTLADMRANTLSDARPDILFSLCSAIRSCDPNARDIWRAEAQILGLTDEKICDVYIPEAARVMGDHWCKDEASFADVTIAVARLQGMLRDLMPSAAQASAYKVAGGSSILMVVLERDYHTLGAGVAAVQLRRSGVSCRLLMDKPISVIAEEVSKSSYDAIMISASDGERLGHIRECIQYLRKVTKGHVPIIVGGSLLCQKLDIKALTSADYVESDPKKALQKCGLIVSNQGMPGRKKKV